MSYRFEIFIAFIISSLTSIGASVYALINKPVEKNSVLDLIIGPLGALVLAVTVLYLSIRALRELVKRNDRLSKQQNELYERLLREKEKENDYLRNKS